MNRTLRRALRSIRLDPWYSAAVIGTLGLGIGVSASAFTVLDRLVFRDPDRVYAPDGLRRVFVTYLANQFQPNEVERQSFSYPEVRAIFEAVAGEAQVAAYENWPTSLSVRLGGEPRQARVLGVGTNYFSVLGVGPALGRFFAAPSALAIAEGPPLEAVISDRYWRRVLASRSDVIGMKIVAYRQTLSIVGIAPPRFGGLNLDSPDVYIPWEISAVAGYGPSWTSNWDGTVFAVAMRFNGTAVDPRWAGRVRQKLTDAAGGVPSRPQMGPVRFPTLTEAMAPDFKQEIRTGTAFWAVSLLVLLVAAVNAGSLFLVRGFEQRRTTAVALALGAGRRRVVGERVAEGLLLAAGGAVLGAVLARFGSEFIRVGIANYIHYDDGLFSWRAFGYSAVVAGLVGVVASALPALRASQVDLRILLDETAGSGSRSGRQAGDFVNGVQVAFAVVVLYAASLFVQSGRAARSTPLGMDIKGVIVAAAELTDQGYDSTATRRFWQETAADLRAEPGVEGVGLSWTLLFRSNGMTNLFVGGTEVPAMFGRIDQDYLDVLRIKVVTGRGFNSVDGPGSERVALLNRTGSERLFAGQSPVGQCLTVGSASGPCVRVVGVVEDTRRLELQEPAAIQVYVPWQQASPPSTYLVVRAKPGAETLVGQRLTALIAKRVPASTQFSVAPMRGDLDRVTGQWVRTARVLAVFGLLAALVTFAGIYGTVAYDQLRRRRELGIRLALGARSGQLVAVAAGRALRWCGAGVAVGAAIAVVAATGIRAMLYGTNPWDVGSMVVVPILALVVVGGAAWLGARRAAVRDPAFLLRVGR